MNYFGGVGEYCTVTSSNLPALADAKIFYMQEAGATSLDSDTVIYAGSGQQCNRPLLARLPTGLGHCDIFDGTGTLAGLHASVTVSHISGYDWAWDGTYRFKN